MKKIAIIFLFFMSGFLSGKLLSDEPNEKIYISPDQVAIDSHSIAILMDEDTIPVLAIRHDDQGLYFLKSEIFLIRSPQSWICRNCGYDNDFWRERCLDCDHRRQ